MPTSTPLRKGSPTPTPVPTRDLKRFVITEQDINTAIAQGIAEEAGLTLDDLAVRFANGKIWVNASRLSYGMIRVQNLTLVARPIVQNGKVTLEFESISPRGLVTAMIPTLANQALQQYGTSWYVTGIQVGDGYLEIRIR